MDAARLASHQKTSDRLKKVAQREQDEAEAILPTTYQGYDAARGLAKRQVLGGEITADSLLASNRTPAIGETTMPVPSGSLARQVWMPGRTSGRNPVRAKNVSLTLSDEPWFLRQSAFYENGIYRFAGPGSGTGYVSAKKKTNNFNISFDFRLNVPPSTSDWVAADIFVFTAPFDIAQSSNIFAPVTQRSDFVGDFNFQISIFSVTIFGLETPSSTEYTHFEFNYDGSTFSGAIGSTPFSAPFSTPVEDYIGIGAGIDSFVNVPGIQVKNFKYNNQLIVATLPP